MYFVQASVAFFAVTCFTAAMPTAVKESASSNDVTQQAEPGQAYWEIIDGVSSADNKKRAQAYWEIIDGVSSADDKKKRAQAYWEIVDGVSSAEGMNVKSSDGS